MKDSLQEISDPREFSDATQHALADFILALADTKRFLGLRYAEWCDGAPTLEASVAASAMAQDELGHSRALLPMLKDFPHVDPGILDEAPREKYFTITFLDQPFPTWPAFIAANVLIGEALTIALAAARNSRYVPLRTRAVKILEEERFHWLHGEGWFKRLAADSKEGFELAEKVEGILPQTLCWFGRSKNDPLVGEAILELNADELRTRFLSRVGPVIAQSQAAHLIKIENGRWQFNRPLPWSRFDPVMRRVD